MSYSEYGLDETKRSEDPAIKGSLYCLWCHRNNVARGYYLCFVNWCICPACVMEGITAFLDHKIDGHHFRITLDECFKKNGKDRELCYMALTSGDKPSPVLGISFGELLIAQKVLKNELA